MVGLSASDEEQRHAPELVALPRRERERLVRLPAPLTRFIGREREAAAVGALLREDGVRLVTLTGPGGVGKSRLALRVAVEVADDFADGAAFVSLAPVRSADLVLPTIAQALGISEGEDRPAEDRLAVFLHEREFLLLLDNFEQVVDAGPALVDLLLACPRLTALATSRAPLHLSGEHVFSVPPLALPSRDGSGKHETGLLPPEELKNFEAIQLFVDRARTAFAGFALTTENAATVAAICERTDGLPLAIELAAARTRALSPADLLARLSPRLPVLTGGPRDHPHRLRTMADAIAWSYDLLHPDEQALFRRLGVFVGGFSLDAAEAVASRGAEPSGSRDGDFPPSTLDALTTLVDESLVQQGAGPGGATRYALLETVREYALERLHAAGEERAVRDAHADWCIVFAERAGPELAGSNHVAWFNRLEAEIGNIRAAHGWLFERADAARALRLGTALPWFWLAAGYFQEGRALFARLVAMPGVDEVPQAYAQALGVAGNLEHSLGNLERAQEHVERALGVCQAHGDRRGSVAMLRTLGSIAVDRNDLARAGRLLRHVLDLAPQVGAAWAAASAANLLGVVAMTRGDFASATAYAEQALAGWRNLDDTGHVGLAKTTAARAAFLAGDGARAAALTREVLADLHDVGDDELTCLCFELAAGLVHGRDTARAARLLAAADAMLTRIGTRRWPAYQVLFERWQRSVRRALGEDAFAAAWSAGAALSLAEATAEAFAALELAADTAASPRQTGVVFAELTAREREILRLLVEGLSDKEIAATLGISRHTASNHVARIRDKLGASTRASAVAIALRDGLVAGRGAPLVWR